MLERRPPRLQPEIAALPVLDERAAQGAIVELEMPEDGLYPMVTHAFNLVGRGALGLLQAGDGDPKN